MTTPLHGLFGAPFADLEHLIDASTLAEIDHEITRGLLEVETGYTGGTLKWMGVVAPWQMSDGYLDAMHVIESLSRAELEELVALADDPSAIDLDAGELAFGDETDAPLSRAQERWLTVRHGVYFPWKCCYHLLDNVRWEDKHSGAGKAFAPDAEEHFPRTIEVIRGLPFTEIGRVVIFGIEANDHAPLHRDTEPGKALGVAQSISIDPRGSKGFYLQNGEGDPPVVVDKRVYWFNDMDYHGVLAAPRFRYSLRIDGVFERRFVREIEERTRASTSRPGARR